MITATRAQSSASRALTGPRAPQRVRVFQSQGKAACGREIAPSILGRLRPCLSAS
jgi:hypothetical protein